MRIALSGTPGTGKTTVARLLARLLVARTLSLAALARRIPHGYDAARKARIVDVWRLERAVAARTGEAVIVEGLLAHELDADLVIILRCNPSVLAARLKRRRWPAAKISENVQAELLDALTIEALERHPRSRIVEIDTTKRTPLQAARLAARLVRHAHGRARYRPGRISWAALHAALLRKGVSRNPQTPGS